MSSLHTPAQRQTSSTSRRSGLAVASSSVVLALCLVTSAFAQQPPGKDKPDESSWGLGLAVVSGQKAYKGVDRETRGLPMLSFENRYVKLSGPNLEVKLPGLQLSDAQRLNFGVVTKLFGGGGYEASDSPFLAGMAERKSSVWAGAKVEWETGLADVKLEWLADASSHSKGQRVVLGLEHKWMLSPSVMLVPQIGAEWVDKKAVDYYYGVRAGEATPGRAAYLGKATVNAELGLTGIYRFDKQQSLMLNVGVKALGKEIKRSPIVDRSTENRMMLGYMYRF
jgi:MipA family protein